MTDAHGPAGAGPLSAAAAGRTLAFAATGLSLLVWPLGFNLGAFDVVFYEDIFNIVVAATVALLASFIVPTRDPRRSGLRRLVLAGPAVWLSAAVLLTDSVGEAAADPLLGTVGVVVMTVSLPYGLMVLAGSLSPELRDVRGRRSVGALAGTVLVVGVAGFLVGRHNDRFLTCEDFKVSGNDLPSNCAPG